MGYDSGELQQIRMVLGIVFCGFRDSFVKAQEGPVFFAHLPRK